MYRTGCIIVVKLCGRFRWWHSKIFRNWSKAWKRKKMHLQVKAKCVIEFASEPATLRRRKFYVPRYLYYLCIEFCTKKLFLLAKFLKYGTQFLPGPEWYQETGKYFGETFTLSLGNVLPVFMFAPIRALKWARSHFGEAGSIQPPCEYCIVGRSWHKLPTCYRMPLTMTPVLKLRSKGQKRIRFSGESGVSNFFSDVIFGFGRSNSQNHWKNHPARNFCSKLCQFWSFNSLFAPFLT